MNQHPSHSPRVDFSDLSLAKLRDCEFDFSSPITENELKNYQLQRKILVHGSFVYSEPKDAPAFTFLKEYVTARSSREQVQIAEEVAKFNFPDSRQVQELVIKDILGIISMAQKFELTAEICSRAFPNDRDKALSSFRVMMQEAVWGQPGDFMAFASKSDYQTFKAIPIEEFRKLYGPFQRRDPRSPGSLAIEAEREGLTRSRMTPP